MALRYGAQAAQQHALGHRRHIGRDGKQVVQVYAEIGSQHLLQVAVLVIVGALPRQRGRAQYVGGLGTQGVQHLRAVTVYVMARRVV